MKEREYGAWCVLTGQARQLSAALASLAAAAGPGLHAGCRPITWGDEFALTPAELAPMGSAVASVRRASGAARIVARELLGSLGEPAALALPRLPSGAPRWPPGFVGSLAHDERFAVAIVAEARKISSVGVDVEPARPLPGELLSIVATGLEQAQLRGDLFLARLLFCMKEAVYKATYPLDGLFLEHHDVQVCLASSTARTRSGRVLRVHASVYPRFLALTVIPTEPASTSRVIPADEPACGSSTR